MTHSQRRKNCEELALSLADKKVLLETRVSWLKEQEPTSVKSDHPSEALRPPAPISIWHPEIQNGEQVFIRPEPGPFGDHYCDELVIKAHPKEGVKRICFFGESAAAGYLYAPHLTPAKFLAHQLKGVAGDLFEVVDLARTNETLSNLAHTIEASLQLKPSLLVVFAGNNWNLLETPETSAYAPSFKGRLNYAARYREKGFEGPLEEAAKDVSSKVFNTFERISKIAGSIPVLLIIPEVNLVDWASRQPAPWLAGDGVSRWHALYKAAVEKLGLDLWREAEQVGLEMLALDEGLCPSTFRILAEARVGMGRLASAEEAFRAEVDSASYALNCFLDAPRAGSIARKTLHFAAGTFGFDVVDLKGVFGILPDREWFADYCHFTAPGMARAMGVVARKILQLEGMDSEGLNQLPSFPITPESHATALFGAAIHGAHRLLNLGSKQEIIRYWCEKALEISPGIASAMLDFVKARCGQTAAVLNAVQQRNDSSPYRLNLQHGWKYDYFDAEVIEAIAVALKKTGCSEFREIDPILLKERGLTSAWVELWPFYLWEPLEQCFSDIMTFDDLTERAFHRSPWPITCFALISKSAAELEITLRLPYNDGDRVEFCVGQRQVGSVSASSTWSTHRLTVSSEVLTSALNRFSIRWPMPSMDGDVAMAQMLERLDLGVDADPHPIFGEIASLKARLL